MTSGDCLHQVRFESYILEEAYYQNQAVYHLSQPLWVKKLKIPTST